MPIAPSARIHPTAIIGPEADLADDVQVGPYVVIEGEVKIGPGCVLKAGAHLLGPMSMGCNNVVHSHAILGEAPQHLKHRGEPTRLEIGDCNIIRELVTIHRGTTESWVTRIGSHNFFMATCHVAHDCQVGSHCLLANGALIAGHCRIDDQAYISGNTVVHQFVRVGRLALMSGMSGTSKDIPPFVIQQGINTILGVNVIGMRRAGIPTANIDAVRKAFHVIYREEQTLPNSLSQIERESWAGPEIRELVAFIRESQRGIYLTTYRAAA